MPALIEMMVLGFSDDIPESIKNKREKFLEKKTLNFVKGMVILMNGK